MMKEDVRGLAAFEMWIWRRMEKVSWKDKKTNEDVLTTVGKENILRTHGLMKDVIEERLEGKRPRGRKGAGILDELMESAYHWPTVGNSITQPGPDLVRKL